jgi:Cu/Ag efflux protein CusF
MFVPRAVLGAFALLSLTLVVGCGGQVKTTGPGGLSLPDGIYDLRGTVLALDTARRIVEIDHEAIPGVMPAMAMPYEVADPNLMQGLALRDRVKATLRVDSRGYILTALQKI